MQLNLNLMQVHIKYRKWCVLAITKKYKREIKLTFAQWRKP